MVTYVVERSNRLQDGEWGAWRPIHSGYKKQCKEYVKATLRLRHWGGRYNRDQKFRVCKYERVKIYHDD